MPKREDIGKVLIIGSGPIVIGQACEFDYSGTQACKALREEGVEVVLVNSNPATIMTDPEMAHRTYVEPLNLESVSRIIERERPQALLPTLGGQTGLNLALELAERGVLARFDVQLIGASRMAIRKAEERELFKDTMMRAGLDVPDSDFANNVGEARRIAERLGFPVIIRPSATLGGTGGGTAYNMAQLEEMAARGLDASPMNEILIEQSVIGWKEYELEMMRDRKGNCVVVCPIENFDPMGIHTGDSITVAPAQTLTDREYQVLRDQAITIMREVGVDAGGSNIQFAAHPQTGRIVVIEMNPRVSRSSALASKATGYPIARIAAKLAIGYTLDELPNDITKETMACFEPTIDYVVVKIPRWAFEKFPGADPTLMTQMKSVGEVMAIGRTFNEALQKALRGLEIGRHGLGADGQGMHYDRMERDQLHQVLQIPHPDRLFQIRSALRVGFTIEELYEATGIDPWFLRHIEELVRAQDELAAYNPKRRAPPPPGMTEAEIGQGLPAVSAGTLRAAKRMGFSDRQIGVLVDAAADEVRARRKALGIEATVKLVDTCAAEFEAQTPYYYLTYEDEDEFRPSQRDNVIILGAGPNRIGQGIEFDYCCVHAAFALRDAGYDAIMVNSNPETVSTDYDTSDKLYFEPLALEDVLNITDKENPRGVIVQFGGQTPLNLARDLERHRVPILGTPPEMIERAENREFFAMMLRRIGARQPDNGTAVSQEQALEVAGRIGYPLLVRPSFVLGGRAMAIVYNDDMLREYMKGAVQASPDAPVLIDKFLEEAIEIDVDAISDGDLCVVGGIMEHIEEAGIHSGDSACVLPPFSLGPDEIEEITRQTKALARELRVRGLMNVQYAIKGEELYVLEVNPRASRTVPFVSKAIGVPLAKLATLVMVGMTLEELGFTREITTEHTAVKCPVFPFDKFSGIDYLLGPEMKSTGEVMGIDRDFGAAFAKAYTAARHALPLRGTIFMSVRNQDKRDALFLGKHLRNLGFQIVATEGTARTLGRAGIEAGTIHRVSEAGSPNAIDLIHRGRIQLIINTPSGAEPRADMLQIRREAIVYDVPLISTVAGAMVATLGIEALQRGELDVRSLQEYHAAVREALGADRR